MTVNKDLLRATMDAVLAHPELHDQGTWATQTECGTAMCFAGWSCRLSGLMPDWDVIEGHQDGMPFTSHLQGGTSIAEAAVGLLGISWESSNYLFDSDNDVATLKDYVDQLCDTGRITPSDPWTES